MDADANYNQNAPDQSIEQFEASWRRGPPPNLADFLPAAETASLDAEARELVEEFVMIDQEYRWRRSGASATQIAGDTRTNDTAGQQLPLTPRLHDYVALLGQLGAIDEFSTEAIANEYRVRHRWGDRPNHQEYTEQFPYRVQELSRALRTVDARLKRSIRSTNHDVRCPYCNDLILTHGDIRNDKLECSSCERVFRLIADEEGNTWEDVSASVGRFKLAEKLGTGAFGSVWKSYDTELERWVAVKLPHYGMLDSSQREQLLREARTAAQLHHPGIVPVYEVGRDGDRLFIVAELVNGVTLSQAAVDQPPTEQDAAILCAKIADALQHAHGHGVIHRDLKPSNVMITTCYEPRIMDFGLAKRVEDEVTMTACGKLLGTPAYMSPEQAKGAADEVDGRSDIYSLGVILFELLTGERPFAGSTEMLVERIVSEDAISPRRLNRCVPRDLESVCLKCLEKNPRHRYQSSADLRNDLQRHLNGEPVLARPITSVHRLWRLCQRRPTVTATGFLAALLLILLAVAGPVAAISKSKLYVAEVAARELAIKNSYESDMAAAFRAWELGDVQDANRLLQKHLPQDGREDLRGFEWFYLRRTCRMVLCTPTLKHGLPVTLCRFSSDGNRIASASGQVGTKFVIKWWDASSTKVVAERLFDEGTITAGAYTPQRDIFALGYDDGRIKTVGVQGPAQNVRLPEGVEAILSLAFSPDGSKLAVQCRNGMMLLDWAEHRLVWRLLSNDSPMRLPPAWFSTLTYSPDGNRLAWSSQDGQVRVGDASTGNKLFSLPTGASALVFHPDGRRLAIGGWDGTVKLWDLDKREVENEFARHDGYLKALCFSRSGRLLATGDHANNLRTSDVESGEETTVLKGHTGGITSLDFSPFADRLATGGEGGRVKIWDDESRKVDDRLRGHTLSVWSTAFSPNGKLLASGSLDGTIRLWNTATGDRKKLIDAEGEWIWSTAFSPQGDMLVSGGGELGVEKQTGRVKLWRIATGELIQQTSVVTSAVRSVAFSPRGDSIAIGTEAGKVLLLDANSLRPAKILGEHADLVHSVAFSPDGRLVASGARDNLAKLWDVRSGKHVRDFAGHSGWVFAVAFSPDGKHLATGSRDTTVRLWQLKGIDEPSILKGHLGWVMCLDFSKDGETLASGESWRLVRLWDVRERKLRATFRGPSGVVFSASFSPVAPILATSVRREVRLWRAPSKNNPN